MRVFLIAICLLMFKLSPALGSPIGVMVLAGQSNMSGSGAIADLPTEPFDFTQPQEDIGYHFWIKASQFHEATEWGLLRPLWPGFRGTTYGPELTFGRQLADSLPNDQIAIIKVSQNGTDLQNDWHPSGENGTLYQTMLDHVDFALGQLEQDGFYPQISGFIWVQGSGDANNADKGAEYEANLNALIAAVRDDWDVNDLPVLFNQFHVDAARPAEGIAAIRQSQANVAAADPLAIMIDIDDLSLSGDKIHFTGLTHLELGNRFAEAILPVIPALPMLGDMDCDGDVDFDDIAGFVLGVEDAIGYEEPSYVCRDKNVLAQHQNSRVGLDWRSL